MTEQNAELISEGELYTLRQFVDMISQLPVELVSETVKKYISILSSSRHAPQKQLQAALLCSELACTAGNDDIMRVLDSLQTLLSSLNDEEVKTQVLACLEKFSAQIAGKHSLLKASVTKMKKEMKLPKLAKRTSNLQTFKILSKYMSPEDVSWCTQLYLADSTRKIRDEFKSMYGEVGGFDFIPPSKRQRPPAKNNYQEKLRTSGDLLVSGMVNMHIEEDDSKALEGDGYRAIRVHAQLDHLQDVKRLKKIYGISNEEEDKDDDIEKEKPVQSTNWAAEVDSFLLLSEVSEASRAATLEHIESLFKELEDSIFNSLL